MENKSALEHRKNILIVNSRSSERKLTGMVMWGALAVASFYKKTVPGSDVIFLDENNEDNFFDKFREALKTRELVGFSLTSMQIKYTLPLIKYIRENYPGIKIIGGGIHMILFPDQDYGDYFDEIVTGDMPKDYFLHELYPEKVIEVFKKKRAQVISGFNCSYKCAFCVNSVRNCKYQSMAPEKICNEIDYLVSRFNPPKIYFRDEDFFQDMDKARYVVDYIIKENYKFVWDVSSRVTHFMPGRVDDEFLEKLVKSGCRQFRFGVESGSQKILNYLRKGQTPKQIIHAVKQCAKYNIHATCSIMIGIPTETAADREETYSLIDALYKIGDKVEILGPQIYRPYPGGLLFEEVKKYGTYVLPDKFEDWATFYDKNPMGDVFDTSVNYPWLSPEENRLLPYVWIVAHYGLNYSKSSNLIKKLIAVWLIWHWRWRWFRSLDVRFFMFLRKKFLKADLE